MPIIPLTQGRVALVDDEDFVELNEFKWYANKMRGNTYYAVRNISPRKAIRMHRVILGAISGQEVDHIDHNGLNNQRENIRLCSRAQNQMNQQKQKNTSSQFKGVSWHKQDKKWRTRITHRGQEIFLGLFKNERVAARTYDKKARELFGEFAKTNF